MEKETVTISKEEYKKLKNQSNIDLDLINQITESLRDIKKGRIRRVK